MREKIVIADDEPGIVAFVKQYLEGQGFEVLTAGDGNQALELAAEKPDLILLDIMMPGMDGLSVCRAIREMVSCPILFLTAKVEEADRVMGFSAGADDYIIKPFSIKELGARVEAHLRREKRKRTQSSRVCFGRLWVDYAGHRVGFENEEIPLARKEYEIIELLSLHAGQVFSRERIYERIWGYDAEGSDSAVTEHIKRLRTKLSQYNQADRIETVWGVGYRWQKE